MSQETKKWKCRIVIAHDSSALANHQRGYHDYICSVTVTGYAEEEAKKLALTFAQIEYTRLKPHNMWCNRPRVIVIRDDWRSTAIAEFNYGYDSGD